MSAVMPGATTPSGLWLIPAHYPRVAEYSNPGLPVATPFGVAGEPAAFQSPFYLLIHSRVISFIHDLAALDYLAHEEIAHRQTPLNLFRCTNQQVKPGGCVQPVQYLDRLPGVPSFERHDDEQIHVRVPTGPAIRVGAEKYDLPWMKLAGNLIAEPFDFTLIRWSNCVH